MSFIIVEIPHQRPATAWVAWKEQDIIKAAYDAENMTYNEWNLDSAHHCFGERDNIPNELMEVLDTGSKAIEFAYSDGADTQWLKVEDAPSELEAAKEALFHDLSAGIVLSEEEARLFVSEENKIYNGHQHIKARSAVRKILSDYFG